MVCSKTHYDDWWVQLNLRSPKIRHPLQSGRKSHLLGAVAEDIGKRDA